MKRVGAVLLVALAGGCSSARLPVAQPTTASTVTTSAPTVSGPATTTPTVDTSECHQGSSPAVYTAASGDYATFLTNVNTAARTMTFDVIQWLSGNAAVAA